MWQTVETVYLFVFIVFIVNKQVENISLKQNWAEHLIYQNKAMVNIKTDI